jgi:hypothetical protein
MVVSVCLVRMWVGCLRNWKLEQVRNDVILHVAKYIVQSNKGAVKSMLIHNVERVLCDETLRNSKK